MKIVRRLFPRWPLIGLTLSMVLVLQAAAIADHLVQANVSYVSEGEWALQTSLPLKGGLYSCTWTRSDDTYGGVDYGNPHKDAWGEDSPGHHANAAQTVSGACPNSPSGGYSSLTLYHRYSVTHTGSH